MTKPTINHDAAVLNPTNGSSHPIPMARANTEPKTALTKDAGINAIGIRK